MALHLEECNHNKLRAGHYLLDWSEDGRGGRGSTENSSSLPCMASILVLANVKGAVGRAIPILTGIMRDSATLHNSSTA